MRSVLVLVLFGLITQFGFAKKFSHESEAGVVVTGGNTNTEVISARTLNTYEINESSTLKAGGRFTQGRTTDVVTDVSTESAKNWDAFLRYEKVLNPQWTIFIQQNIESDKYSGYAQRYNSDIGARWNIVKKEKWYTFAELGYRYTLENNVIDTLNIDGFEDGQRKANKARLFYEIGGDINTNVFARFWAEYVPNFDESEDWIVTFEPSLGVTLSKSFSLKFAFRGIYDNQVNIVGNKKFDYIYTTGIIAKF